ncbi:chorismate-binding protein [Polaribacter tangerinus]|uniref:chorismate-binding protein n=1 Tax=Polaribacter tangerinus TaxID=1920034 RepID=UPI001E58023E|nr:chorismate-binding protein [Polaribacter tangerinus]
MNSKIADFFSKKLPFVVYRKPNENLINGLFMNNSKLVFTQDFNEEGFVFAPFDSDKKAVLFPIDNATLISESFHSNIINKQVLAKQNSVDDIKNAHLKIVKNAIEKISQGDLKKVVISRKELVSLNSFDVISLYNKLLTTYATAFVYVWYHPKVGLWFGASPETLLETTNTHFKTMSLAGTQLDKGTANIIWQAKELEEQQMVTTFIEKQLRDISSDLKTFTTETVKAGSLLHLRTKVTGVLKPKTSLKNLIRALHPTPAVCGLPRDKAKEFILHNETYDRTFYTGFLGEINFKSQEDNTLKTALFVNLRCMNIKDKDACIYVGGGITKESDPLKEWEETVSKSLTMKKVLI